MKPESRTRRGSHAEAPRLTLADVAISWEEGGRLRQVTGRQIAHLLTAAATRSSSDRSIGYEADDTGQWIYRLQGLAALISPDGGESIREPNARALISDIAELAAAELAADQLDSADWPTRFVVQIVKGEGQEC